MSSSGVSEKFARAFDHLLKAAPKNDFVRGYLLFERWTLIDPDEMHRRRATWPVWRRMLRPVAATLWWLGLGLGLVLPAFEDFNPWTRPFVLATVMLSVIVACAVLGISLEWRDRRREGRDIVA